MTIFLGADHCGNELKEFVKKDLSAQSYVINDLSPATPEGGDDYADYAFAVGEAVAKHANSVGILICDTGIGMSIAANKVAGIRAALVTDVFSARRAREHNDANIIVLGAQITDKKIALEAVKYFLEINFTHAERHVRRLNKIVYYEKYGKQSA